MRRMPCLSSILCFAAAVAVVPSRAALPDLSELDAFGKVAATALETAGRFGDRAVIDWWRPARKMGFAFPGKGPGGFESVECERVQELHLVASATEVMRLNVGACKREARRVRDLAAGAGEASARSLETLKGVDPGAVAKLGRMLAHGKVPLADGMIGDYFAMMWIGHGVGFVHEAVVYGPARDVVFIVMAAVTQRCAHSSPGGKPFFPTVFCPETGKALLEVAAELATQVKP